MKLQNETQIKVIDFGSSCYEHQRGAFDRGIVQMIVINNDSVYAITFCLLSFCQSIKLMSPYSP